MLEKTRAIVLHQIKYSDSGIVVHLYTRRFGRQSVMIKGVRNKKAGRHSILFQPMSILDLELYYKSKREMQMLKESSVFYSPHSIHTDVRKTSVALFLGEVLSSILREENPQEEMFDFLESSIIYFDKAEDKFANFHIAFLAGLSSWLGFEPSGQSSPEDLFFDMKNGIFLRVPPVHGNYASQEISAVLAQFFAASYDSSREISLYGKLRNDVLSAIVEFYSLHLPTLKKINSLEVLKEVFKG